MDPNSAPQSVMVGPHGQIQQTDMTGVNQVNRNLAPVPNPAAGTSVQKLMRRGHQIELLQEAKQLCDRQDYVDLTIYCEDGVVRAHQMLLATASPFLKLLFQTSPLYGIDDISLILPEVKACLVQALIHFVYTGTVVSKEDHFYSLMKLVYALNINASIEAESTTEKPTSFSPPLASESLVSVKKLPHQTVQNAYNIPQQPISQPQQYIAALPTTPLAPNVITSQPQLMSAQPIVSLPTQPVPPSKVARLQTPQLPQVTQPPKMSIQLPTQPVPISGMVNGTVKTETTPSVGSYIAFDPNTGVSYKVEMSNGPVGSNDNSDPLAAIMNETIFTDASGGATVYAGENGTVVYANQNANIQGTTQTVAGVNQPGTENTPRGKKRKAGKENIILAESVEDLPCTPDDEDINTPYPCNQCSKTIKGKVMLQAHQYQEHYDNPDINTVEVGDKHICRVCLKLFTRNSDVKAHILRVHCGDRRYPCKICGKRFKESTHLRKHLYTHTGERPHFCDLCNKGFQTSSDLKRHKRTKVHQERVEQAGGEPIPQVNESKDDINSEGTKQEIETSEFTQWNNKASIKVENTTQELLNNISAPIGSEALTANSSVNSTTIDMKALGDTTWNNNQQTVTMTTPSSSVQSIPVSIVTSGQSANSTTVDLKAIGSTVDINALKWQQQQVVPLLPQAVAIKKNSSVDSPSEERLSVIDGVVQGEGSQESAQPTGTSII